MSCLAPSKLKEIGLSFKFLMILWSITSLNDAFQVIYYNWLMLLYSYVSLAFYFLARNSSFLSRKAYFLWGFVFFVFGFENTLYEFGAIIISGFFDPYYMPIMYGCLIVLVVSVTYDRISTIKLRVDNYMR